MSDICDLCNKESNVMHTPASVLDGIENLEKMCDACNDELSAALLEARKFVHKFINDKLVEASDIIRARVKNEE